MADKNQEKKSSGSYETPQSQSGADDAMRKFVTQLMQQFQQGQPIPFALTQAPGFSLEQKDLMGKINNRLRGINQIPPNQDCITPLSVAFPDCSDVLLSLITDKDDDEIEGFFNDYFMFCDHHIIVEHADAQLNDVLDNKLLGCTKKWFGKSRLDRSPCQEIGRIDQSIGQSPAPLDKPCDDPFPQKFPAQWPPFWCLPPTCITISGKRCVYNKATPPPNGSIKRLFVADLMWLYWIEKMGIFRILGEILDDFATKGRYPISNGSVNAPGIGNKMKDDVIAIVLEAMVRAMKRGDASSSRDRASAYMRVLGRNTDVGKKLEINSVVNTGFREDFDTLIRTILQYTNVQSLGTAIRGIGSPGKTDVPQLAGLSQQIDKFKKSFDAFGYGRNYSVTLSGIVWGISGMALIRDLSTSLKIPSAYDKPYEYIPAAYNELVAKKTEITPTDTNRYLVHRECANNARCILLDLEALNHKDIDPGGELDLWLSVIAPRVEAYRVAHRDITGIDLRPPGNVGK